MTLNFSMPRNAYELKPRITVIGVGGAGGNAVNNMIRSNLEGVEFIVSNTDAQALSQSLCERRIQLGVTITQGLGAGSRPDLGRAAAEEVLDQVIAEIQGSHMVFITAGMGGGTGTGAAPVIARAAREHGILTVGVVTKPFDFEGIHRRRTGEGGIDELQQYVDTLIVIPNQNLFRIANEKTTFADAFAMADQVLYSGVRGVTDLMVMPGLINLDFADIRAVMSEMGKAMMGTGEASGDSRATNAAQAAISNPLLDEVSMKGARGVLINVTGGPDLTLYEVDEAATKIREEVDPEANIIFGSTFDDSLAGKVRISVVATGIDAEAAAQPRLTLIAKGGRVISTPGAVPAESAQAPAPMYQPVYSRAREEQSTQARAPATTSYGMATQQEPVRQAAGGSGGGMPAWTPQPQPQMAPPRRTAAEAPEFQRPPRPPQVDPRETMTFAPERRPAPMAELPFESPAAEPAPSERVHPERATAERTRAEPAPRAAAEPQGRAVADKSGGAGLFTRITNSAANWTKKTTQDLREATPAAMMTRMATGEPVMRGQGAGTSQPPSPAEPQPSAAAQARLSGLDAADRLASRPKDDDILDIPAFLRRQAN